MTKLFQGNVALGNFPLLISYSVKLEEDSEMGLALNLCNSSNAAITVFLAPEGPSLRSTSIDSHSKLLVQLPDNNPKTAAEKLNRLKVGNAASGHLQISNDWILRKYGLEMDGYTLTAIYAVSYKGMFDSVKFSEILKTDGSVPSVSTVHKTEALEKKNAVSDESGSSSSAKNSEKTKYNTSVGHISLASTNDDEGHFPPTDSWDINGDNTSWDKSPTGEKMLSIKLDWKLKTSPDSTEDEVGAAFLKYNIYVEKINPMQANKLRGVGHVMEKEVKYLGVAQVQSYYVSQLLVPTEYQTLKFFLQPSSSLTGDTQPLKDAPSFSIHVPPAI
eukprot:Gb_18479 [translate_table: standard]